MQCHPINSLNKSNENPANGLASYCIHPQSCCAASVCLLFTQLLEQSATKRMQTIVVYDFHLVHPFFDALRCIGIHMLRFTRFEIGELKTFILISCSKCHHHHKTATHHRSVHRNAMHSRLAKAEVSLTVCWWSAIAKTFICLQCAFCRLTVLLTENIQFLNHRTMPHISFIRRERHNEISSSEIHFRKLLNLIMHRNA